MLKSLKILIREDVWVIFGPNQSKGLSGFREILHEMAAETRMPKEASHPFHISRR